MDLHIFSLLQTYLHHSSISCNKSGNVEHFRGLDCYTTTFMLPSRIFSTGTNIVMGATVVVFVINIKSVL